MQSQTCLSPAERGGLRTKGNVPTLRFPEFSGEWEKYRLGDIMEFTKERISTSLLTEDNYVSTENMLQDFQGVACAHNVPENTNVMEYKQGDVLVSNIRPYLKKVWMADKDGGCSADVFVMRANRNVCTDDFLHHIVANDRFIGYVMSGAKGVKMPRGDKEQMKGYETALPSLIEQQKVAHLLAIIDERISAQIRIINKLKSLMQALNNELMDNPKWEKVYVGDFMEFFPTNSLSWEQLNYDNGQVRNLHYGLIHSGLPTLVDCQKAHLPYIQVDSLPKQYSICKDGDVALADASEDTAEVGKTVELTNIETQTIVCGLHTIHGRDCKDITVNGFKGFAFNSKYFHDQLRRIAQGSKVYSINTDNLKSCYLCIPTITEQKKIVGLLHCLQDKIGVAEQELFLYESQKRFLLNNLFV